MSYLMDDNPDNQQYNNQNYNPLPTPPETAYATEQVILPKVGQTRCYWALLSSDLQFIYLDPVLNYHLGDQAELLVGKSLLSFVHPDEQASAKRDLGSVLESKTLHGSVTRVRYSRLSSVRRQLGYQGPGPDWVDADKISLDKDYLAVDLVINWAAEGLVLCFIHAVVDLNIADNDEVNKTDWTNWCGTPWMPPEQLDIMYRHFLMCVPQTGSMSRVFQILLNERERPFLISWPPDSGQGPASGDFAKLVENIQISNRVSSGSDAKTSCTRRYKALQDMPAVFGCQVESIFIPHGTIIFACHKVNPPPPRTSTAMNQVDYSHYPPYYDPSASYNLPPVTSHETAYSNGFSHTTYTPQRWPSASVTNVRDFRSDYPTSSPTLAWPSTSPSSTANYIASGSPGSGQQHPAFERDISPHRYSTTYTSISSGGGSSSTQSATAPAVPPSTDLVPPSRRRVSPNSSRDRDPSTGQSQGSLGSYRGTKSGSAGMMGVSKPAGILKCSSCKTTQSPEWRKGPSGKKELCNACGLRFARSRAKKEGPLAASSRRRKEKGDLAKRESATPPSSAPYPTTVPKGGVRRNFTDHSSSIHSCSDPYIAHPHPPLHHHHMLDNHSPSPSPPSSTSVAGVGLIHYSRASGHGQGHEIHNRPPPPPSYSSSSHSLYSPSSPLSSAQHLQNYPPHSVPSPAAHHHHHQQHQPHHPQAPQQQQHHPQLPPLDQIKTIHSPIPSSAYEHERDDVRGQQPQQHAPLSARETREGYRRPM